MQETQQLFRVKCSITLRQAKTSKHECRNVTATLVRCCYISALMLTYFRPTKGRAMFFRLETILASLLQLVVLFSEVISNHTSKRQFVGLRCLSNTTFCRPWGI